MSNTPVVQCKCCKKSFQSLKCGIELLDTVRYGLCENCSLFISWLIEYHLCRLPRVFTNHGKLEVEISGEENK